MAQFKKKHYNNHSHSPRRTKVHYSKTFQEERYENMLRALNECETREERDVVTTAFTNGF